MAFTVAPTSGSAPYVLSATFAEKYLIDDINYRITVRFSQATGSCPAVGVADTLSESQLADLLENGSTSSAATVSSGACRTFTLRILRVSDSAVVASSSVYIDNI